MNNLRNWFVAMLGSLILASGFPGDAMARLRTADAESVVATITESHGDVFKRGFIDWKKDEWAAPEPAQPGDSLSEGMQIGTRAHSWAQVSWPNVIARAWENSVFAVAPNRRLVYLSSGEMLIRLDKHRKDRNSFYIWTKTLQARIHGTSVLVQATREYSRITVLEGEVVLLNRINHSVVNLKPGLVFQVSNRTGASTIPPGSGAGVKPSGSPGAAPLKSFPAAPQPPGAQPAELLPDICSNKQTPVELFKTAADTSAVTYASVEKLLAHPLVDKFEHKLDSLPLINHAMSNLPPVCHDACFDTGNPVSVLPVSQIPDNSQATHVLVSSCHIKMLPTTSKYEIGSSALQQFALPPGVLKEFPPAGLIASKTDNVGHRTVRKPEIQSNGSALPVENAGNISSNNTNAQKVESPNGAVAQNLNNVTPQSLSNLSAVVTQNLNVTQDLGSVNQYLNTAQGLTQDVSSASESLSSAAQSLNSAAQTLNSVTQSLGSVTQSVAQTLNSANQSLNSVSQSLNNLSTQNLSSLTSLSNISTPGVSNIVTPNLGGLTSQNLSSLTTQNIGSLAAQNLNSIPTQNFTNFAALNLNNTFSQNLANTTRSVSNLSTQSLTNVTGARGFASQTLQGLGITLP